MSESETHIDQFVEDLKRQEAAPKTVTNYRSDLVCFARWFRDSTPEPFSPGNITATDIRTYKSYLQTVAGCAPATINRRLAALRKFLHWAMAAKQVSENPAIAVKGVKSPQRGPRSLEKRLADRLVRAVEKDAATGAGKRNLAIVVTLLNTGLRVGELCALRLTDLRISERKGTVTVRSGKGSKHRTVPLNIDARQALERYLEVRPATGDDHVFLGQRGPLTPQAVELVIEKYARLAGLDEVTPHTLRHTFAKRLLDAGANLVTVASLLGHERIETTARYTQPTNWDLEKAVGLVETR